LQNTITLLGKKRHFSPSASRGSLALVNQTNGTKNFSRFGKNGKKGNTSKGIPFFPENFHWDEQFHLNSSRNYRVFHTNGKRSL